VAISARLACRQFPVFCDVLLVVYPPRRKPP
jgi:hypothetical protein